MTLEISRFILGPLDNNTYLLGDPLTRQAVLIDPSFYSESVIEAIQNNNWQLQTIWITHGHFDHFAGARLTLEALHLTIPIALHPADLPLWRNGGGAASFGYQYDPGADPGQLLEDGEVLNIGKEPIEVRHTPGHAPGHVVFYVAQDAIVFCGDLIFKRGIGRTDLPGGSYATLVKSISERIFTLPPATRLLPGHGPETTVGAEMQDNPYL